MCAGRECGACERSPQCNFRSLVMSCLLAWPRDHASMPTRRDRDGRRRLESAVLVLRRPICLNRSMIEVWKLRSTNRNQRFSPGHYVPKRVISRRNSPSTFSPSVSPMLTSRQQENLPSLPRAGRSLSNNRSSLRITVVQGESLNFSSRRLGLLYRPARPLLDECTDPTTCLGMSEFSLRILSASGRLL